MKDSRSIQKGRIVGKKLIQNIGHQLHLDENIIANAVDLYDRVYDGELHNRLMDTKKAMCLACLYASARIYNNPISFRELGFFLDINDAAKKFGSALKSLKNKYDVHMPAINIESETYRIMSHSNLPSSVIKTTQQLMLLMQRAYITQGRGCTSCALPCAYFAWKSTDILKNRKVSLKAFCKMFNFTNTFTRYKVQIENALITMAKELPWLKGSDVELDHVEIYINDIICFQSSLLAETMQTAISKIEECDGDDTDKEVDVTITKEHDLVHVFRKFPQKRKRDETLEIDNGRQGASVEKKAKIKCESGKRVIDGSESQGDSSGLESLDLGSDDDTDLYILSMHEVMLKQEINTKFERHGDETGSGAK